MDHSGDADAMELENHVFRPLPRQIIEANLSPAEIEAAREKGERDPLALWAEAASDFSWFREWDAVLDDSEAPFYRWFPGAKANIAYNALDRHARSWRSRKLALVWESERGECRKYTYFELLRETCRLANALKSLGVEKGDRVIIYMPPLPETVTAMLASARLGASHCLVFAGFSAKALRKRIEDSRAKVVVTADGFFRNGKEIPLKPQVDQALSGGCCSVETVVMVRRSGAEVEMVDGRDFIYDEIISQHLAESSPAVMDASDELFLLYSSGSTGEPKGVVHVHGGYMVGVGLTTRWVLDLKDQDLVWCLADPAWITGHSYAVYGPLLAGCATLLFEGRPLGSQGETVLDVVERHGVSALYATPTIIRMMRRYIGAKPVRQDLRSLRLLATVGEPIAPDAWLWFHKVIGRGECPLLDTWWQTETGMIMISPLPASALKPGSVGRPLPGIAAEVVDGRGRPVPAGENGYLVLKKPWPALCAGLLGSPASYAETYWRRTPGAYWTGDMARKDEDGYFWIQGRADDALNIAGRRMGNAELENALATHKAVAEAAVVGVPDPVKGETAKAFIVPIENWEDRWSSEEELMSDLKRHLRNELGPVAAVRAFALRASLPKTSSGKVNRKALKDEEARRTSPALSGKT